MKGVLAVPPGSGRPRSAWGLAEGFRVGVRAWGFPC